MKHTLRRQRGRGARWLALALVVGAAPALWESQWTNPAGPGNFFFQGNFEADPNNSNLLFLGGVLFYRSTDDGATFSLPTP